MSTDAGAAVDVLGVFEARVGGVAVAVGGPLQRLVLSRMIATGGVSVTMDQIVADVWGDRPAQAGSATLHPYISRLRKLLGADVIQRRDGAYVLDRRAVVIDADRFTEEVTTGRQALARADDTTAVEVLGKALERWRGRHAYGELGDAPCLAAEIARLAEMRTAAAEMLADALARRGGDGAEIELLEELAAHDPLRESLALRLMRALYAVGRQADALVAFERCRHALADQLGVDPTPALRAVHASVLAQKGRTRGPLLRPVVLTNLPPRNRSFIGRTTLLARLERALDDDRRRPHAIALTGLSGAGKTETALELAYRRVLAGRVAWWIPAEDPTRTAAGIADLAAALDITPCRREQDTHAELWKALDRLPGWVLVFDNADDPDLLARFLPTAVHGDVVITPRNPSWRRLAEPVVVPIMDRRESVGYLTWRSGDPDATGADALAELLGDLPLALEQAGAYIEQTGMTIQDYVRLFERRRPTMLLRETPDGRTVATTWGLAFDRLKARSALAATVLETIAFLSPDTIGIALLLPLAADELSFHDALAEMLRFSLVDRQTDTLRVHRLVQDVVRARMSPDTVWRRLAAATRLCTGDPTSADSELATHLMVLGNHSEHGETARSTPPGLVTALAAMARCYSDRVLYPVAEQMLRQALRLINRQDDMGTSADRAALTCQLGEVLDAAGRLDEALVTHQEAVALLADVVGHDDVVSHVHNRLGHVLSCADRHADAIAEHRLALATLLVGGRDELLAPVHVDLGYTLWALGRLDDARAALEAGLDLLARHGRQACRDWAHATAGLGMVAQDAGDLDRAVVCHQSAIALFTAVCGADHPDTAQALDKLGYTLRLQGHVTEAIAAHRRGVSLLERFLGRHDSRVAMTLTNLCLAYADAGRIGAAIAAQSRAHAIFESALGRHHTSTVMAGTRWAAVAGAAPPGQRRLDDAEQQEPAAAG